MRLENASSPSRCVLPVPGVYKDAIDTIAPCCPPFCHGILRGSMWKPIQKGLVSAMAGMPASESTTTDFPGCIWVTLGWVVVNPPNELNPVNQLTQIQGAKSNVQDEDTLEKPHLLVQKSGKSSQPRKRIGHGFFPQI